LGLALVFPYFLELFADLCHHNLYRDRLNQMGYTDMCIVSR
jgi:hypothetical protein